MLSESMSSYYLATKIRNNPDAAVQELQELFLLDNSTGMSTIASHKNSPDELLRKVHYWAVQHGNDGISQSVASNANASLTLLKTILNTGRAEREILGNPNVPVTWGYELLENSDTSKTYRAGEQILYNLWSSPELLRKAWSKCPTYIIGFAVNKRGKTLPVDLQYVALFDPAHNGAGVALRNLFQKDLIFKKQCLLNILMFLGMLTEEDKEQYQSMPVSWVEEVATSFGIPVNER